MRFTRLTICGCGKKHAESQAARKRCEREVEFPFTHRFGGVSFSVAKSVGE